jgi:TPR repeat protein
MSDRFPLRFGAYEASEVLGRGGMAEVLRGRRLADGAPVAIKVLLQTPKATQRTRFLREARALAALDHAHVLHAHEVGEVEGRPYLVLDLVEQGSLEERLVAGALPWAQVARLGVQLASALAAAHALHIVHRDVKPANVLMLRPDHALLGDFGLVKQLDRVGHTRNLTHSGVFLGTPGFWSPEQAMGRAHEVGPPSDVYSLGATLYTAVTGQTVFEGDSLLELAVRTSESAPVPPRELCPHLPPRLNQILLACLEKAPEARPSAAELAQALLDPSAPLESKVSRKAVWIVTAAAVAALAGGASWLSSRPGEAPAPSAVPRLNAAQLLALGKEHLSAGREPSAVTAFERAVGMGDVDAMLALGKLLVDHNLDVEEIDDDELARGVDLLRRAVDRDHPPAQALYATLLLHGVGVEKDEVQARALAELAAGEGNTKAMATLGYMWANGLGGAKSRPRALDWLRQAARAGHLDASFNLAFLLGKGDPREVQESRRWTQLAAEGGLADAMDNMGQAMEYGIGGPQDLALAAEWYQRGAQAGSAHAMNNLGTLYERGMGVTKSAAAAADWYQRAGEAGNTRAFVNLAVLLEKGGEGLSQDLSGAVASYLRAAEAGDLNAMNNLGNMYSWGRGVTRDLQQARLWWERGAKLSHPPCMNSLGALHGKGLGVPENQALATEWYRKAAEAGLPMAMGNYASQLAEGSGAQRDPLAATRWYRRAAEKGHALSMYNLGVRLLIGEGAQADKAEAVLWFRRVSVSGVPRMETLARNALRKLRGEE